MSLRKYIPALLSLALALALFLPATGQILSKEKVHKISGKAYKGGLQGYVVDEASNSIQMTYIIKDSKRKLVLEHYYYDLDLNFVKKEQEEIEKDRARTKFKWYWDDNTEPIRLLKVGNNVAGQVVLKKGYLQIHVANRSVWTTFETTDKMKPKDADGDKMSLVTFRTEIPLFKDGTGWNPERELTVALGDATVVAHVNNDIPYKDYTAMVIEVQSLEMVKKNNFSFDYLYFPLADAEMGNGDLSVLFGPLNGQTIVTKALKKGAEDYPFNPNQKEVIYMRFSPDARINERYSFELPTLNSHLKIVDEGDGVALIGVADEITPTFMAMPWVTREPGYSLLLTKPTHFIYVRLEDGKTQFISSTELGKMLDNSVLPEGSKAKLPPSDKPQNYFNTNYLKVTEAFEMGGRHYVCTNTDIQNVMQFDGSGNFEKAYFNPIDKGSALTQRSIIPGPGNSIYWLSLETDTKDTGKRWLKVVRIDPSAKTMGSVLIPGRKKYSMDPQTPAVAVNNGSQLIVLGSGKKKVYLGKVDL